MKIILVRHGQTQANISWKYSTDDTVLAESGLYILDKTKKLLEDYKIEERLCHEVSLIFLDKDPSKLKESAK